MSEFKLFVLPRPQRSLWHVLARNAAHLQGDGYYLAGGTALALQLGHRQSIDFDFFSEQSSRAERTESWLRNIPGFMTRDIDVDTLHGEISNVKVSFIGGYQYPPVEEMVELDGVRIAGLRDIGLMKLLAITHRAAPRDYIDLAGIFRTGCSLAELIGKSREKYGKTFNPMVSIRALASFSDVHGEIPIVLDRELASSWKEIIRAEVRRTTW